MKCVLEDKECIECGKCNMCDLDPTKVCDNCCKCIEVSADYGEILIDAVFEDTNGAEYTEFIGQEIVIEKPDEKLVHEWDEKLRDSPDNEKKPVLRGLRKRPEK